MAGAEVGQTLFEDGGRVPPASQAKKRQGRDSLPEPPEGIQPADTLILGCKDSIWTSASTSIREYISSCLKTLNLC